MNINLEYVKYKNKILAIILRKKYKSNQSDFFTPNNYSQQLGFLKFKKNHEIIPHYHNPIKRIVNYTRETLIIRSGAIRVDFYEKNKKYLKSRILKSGDIILLVSGGHGFHVLKKTDLVEIKQGPYNPKSDKNRFNKPKNIKLKF
jgi:hypothetical protein